MRTKIVATLGPASQRAEVILRLAREGVSGFRINFAHGSEEEWLRLAQYVREAEKRVKRDIALIGDLQGPCVRIGEMPQQTLRRGDVVRFVERDRVEEVGVVPVPIHQLFEVVEEGDVVLIDDGRVALRVEEVRHEAVEARSLVDGVLSPRKSLVVAGKDFDFPPVTEYDLQCLRFAAQAGFDYVGVSYVRTGSDIEAVRRAIQRERESTELGVLAKIETRRGVENLKEIAERADGLVVARGDLGMHFPLEEIPRLQRRIISVACKHLLPSIVATQLLESMTQNPVPTRSEVVDVTQAVVDGADALMLTSETAHGRHPIAAVRWLRRIIRAAEREKVVPRREPSGTLPERFAYGVVSLAESLQAIIAVYTRSGLTARRIASLRPRVPFYIGSCNASVRRRLAILWGVRPILVTAESYEEGIRELLRELQTHGYVRYGNTVVLTYGITTGVEHTIRILQIE